MTMTTPTTRDVPQLLAALDRRLAAAGGGPAPPEGYVPDAKGRLVPERLVRPADALEDQTVRRILAYGIDLADQIARFRSHTADDLTALLDTLAESYGQKRGGRRGNCTFHSYDGRLKVTLHIQDTITFGPELQIAKTIIDECVAAWSDGASDELLALVQHAFQVDKQGQVNRAAIVQLRRLNIDDPRWTQVRQAISDSMRMRGSKVYLRLAWRPSPEAAWRPVPIDLAGEWTDPTDPPRSLPTPAADGEEAGAGPRGARS